MKKIFFVALFCLGGVSGYGQFFPVKEIPLELLNGASSVVRKCNIEFIQSSPTSGMAKYETVTTVLKKGHVDAAMITFSCDRYRTLKNFSGEVYDAHGKLLYKIKKSDLLATEYSESFASDDKKYMYRALSAEMPYTVKYNWEIQSKLGILLFPHFFPIEMCGQALETASYKIIQPKENLNYKCMNIPTVPIKKVDEGFSIEWQISKIKPINDEYFSDYIKNLPYILAAPVNFECDGTSGDMTNWKTFGDWHAALSEGSDVLSDAVKKKVHEIVADKTTDRDKVAALYDYLARSTRYISIQLGLGGWRPIAANEVARAGFGDCKGLSNYMRAMLKEVGLESFCVAIHTLGKDMYHDMASLGQANHMILKVPLKDETLWLECTHAELPLGFIHSSIAGHEAFLIEKDNSRLERLPNYPDSLNSDDFIADVTFSGDGGKTIVKVTKRSKLFHYENLMRLMKKSSKEQIDYFRKEIRLSEGRISELTIIDKKEAEPQYIINYVLESGQYALQSGARLYIPVTIFRGKGTDIAIEKERQTPIVVDNGFTYNDSIKINIPNGYEIEFLPKDIDFNCDLGNFKNSIKVVDNQIIIGQFFQLKRGDYSVSKNIDLLLLYRTANSCYQDKIILRKK